MSSSPPISLFARKGKAAPTPVREDGYGFAGRPPEESDPATDDGASTVIAFGPVGSASGDSPEIQAEAASMLGIPLVPRAPAAVPSDTDDTDTIEATDASSADISPPESAAPPVTDDSPTAVSRAGRRRWMMVTFAIIAAAILAGVIYFLQAIEPEPKIVSTVVALPPPGPETEPVAAPLAAPPAVAAPPAAVAPPKAPPPVAVAKEPRATTPKPVQPFALQLASLPSSRDAARELRTLKRRYGDRLSAFDVRVVPGFVTGKGRVWRIRAMGLPSAAAAKRACRVLGIPGGSCLVINRR